MGNNETTNTTEAPKGIKEFFAELRKEREAFYAKDSERLAKSEAIAKRLEYDVDVYASMVKQNTPARARLEEMNLRRKLPEELYSLYPPDFRWQPPACDGLSSLTDNSTRAIAKTGEYERVIQLLPHRINRRRASKACALERKAWRLHTRAGPEARWRTMSVKEVNRTVQAGTLEFYSCGKLYGSWNPPA